ncbi:MAG: hypothetical protein AAGH64_09450, partial [Planctomycetota bacterium]
LALLTVHTGVVNLHRWRIDANFHAIRSATEVYLAPNPPPIDPEDRARLEAGVRTYERMTSITPVYNERAHGRYAVMLLALGRFDEAERAFASLEERTKADDPTAAIRAQLVLRDRRIEEAHALTLERTTEHPDFWETRDVRNRILAGTGRAARALAEAEAATAQIREHWRTREARSRTWEQVARLRAQARDAQGAMQAIDTAVEIDPSIVPVGELRAAFRLQIERDPGGAIEEMRRVTRYAPRDAALCFRFLQLAAALRDRDLAREQGERYLELIEAQNRRDRTLTEEQRQRNNDDASRAVAGIYRSVGITDGG